MASEVDICNLALGFLGDTATVASLEPPEGSAQAEHCARFYPIARDTLLQMHAWGFASRRVQLAEISGTPYGWTHAYARPIDALDIIAIQRPGTPDYAEDREPFVCETGLQGNEVIYCNVEGAIARYTARITDTTRFPPAFVTALAWQLASFLAGPILKGDAGAAESKRCAQLTQAYVLQAIQSDSRQRHIELEHTPDWVRGRSRLNAPGWGR